MAADLASPVFRPELLAPAGNLETALAAFDAGADAVYLGLGKFNARSRAENFTPDQLARLLDCAHGRGRKVHVTFNTLATEPELPEVMEHLAILADLEPDAVIVQDFGILALLRRYFPHLTIHASTQMGIHNSAGVAELARLGAKRVILERQLTLEEIRRIAARATVELEVFLHGSLCVSLSGRCLLSAYAEHASGNRGACRQLCRRFYRWRGGEGFPLSPTDLAGLTLLGEYSKLKIASLKIEGRLRGPDYVHGAVAAYRKALDALPEASPEAAELLRRTVSRRSGTGTGYGFAGLIHPGESGVFGHPAGRIEKAAPGGVAVQCLDRIHLGDRMRIADRTGESLAGFLLTGMRDRTGRTLTAAKQGMQIWIPGSFPGVTAGMTLYKLGENGCDFRRRAETLPPARRNLELRLRLEAGKITATLPALPDFVWSAEGFEVARNRAWSAADLQTEFAKLPEELWRPAPVIAAVAGDWFCPAGRLKELRRACQRAVGAALAQTPQSAGAGAQSLLAFARDYRRERTAPHPAMPTGASLLIPGFLPEAEWERWREKVREAWQKGVRIYRLGGIHALSLVRDLPEKERFLLAVPPWATANSIAAALLTELGVNAAEAHPELPEAALTALQKHSPLPILPCSGPTPLLTTRMVLPVEGVLSDRQGRRFRLERERGTGLTNLWADDGRAEETFRKSDAY